MELIWTRCQAFEPVNPVLVTVRCALRAVFVRPLCERSDAD